MFERKKILLLVIGLVSSMLLFACSQGTTSNEGADSKDDGLHIGYSSPNGSDKFLSYVEQGAEEYASTVDNLKVSYVDAQLDSSTQMSQISNFITQGVDAIVYLPVDVSTAPDVVDMANDAGIPIIVVNREYPEMDQATSYVGGLAIESGIMQMEQIAERNDGKGNIAVIGGIPGEQATRDRMEGNKQVLKDYPNLEIVLDGTGKWDRTESMTLMENWLNSSTEFNIVATHNDEMAIGAYMAAESAGKADDYYFGTIDAMPEALEYIKSGKIDFAIHQEAVGQGTKGMEIAVKSAQGEEVEKIYEIPYELVTKENVEEYEARWK